MPPISTAVVDKKMTPASAWTINEVVSVPVSSVFKTPLVVDPCVTVAPTLAVISAALTSTTVQSFWLDDGTVPSKPGEGGEVKGEKERKSIDRGDDYVKKYTCEEQQRAFVMISRIRV